MEQCRCATECEWLPEHYTLEHHPACPVVAGQAQPTVYGQSATTQIRLINVIDEKAISDFLSSAAGEAVILNHILKKPGTWRTALRIKE